jgi:hypothetical protein
VITRKDARNMEAALKEAKSSTGNSPLAYGPAVARRETVMKGETPQQAKARWAREREIEQDRDRDVRHFGDRVMPVFYE